MERIVIELLQPGEIPEASALLGRAMCTNPVHVAVFRGQGEEERRRLEAMFRLLESFCEHLDRLQAAGYLETDRPENVPLYERFGFSVIGEAPVYGARSWFMWRPPRQDAL